MDFSKITSKNQTTIPKRIRALLDLQTDDYIHYHVENGRCYIQKAEVKEICPVCNGKGEIDSIYECFICDETGYILAEEQGLKSLMNAYKYGLSYQFHSNIEFTNKPTRIPFSTCVLKSDRYPLPILNRAQDYIQLTLMKKQLPFMNGNITEEVRKLSFTFMQTEEGKQALQDYFNNYDSLEEYQ